MPPTKLPLLIILLIISFSGGFLFGSMGKQDVLISAADLQKLQAQIEQAKKFFPSTPTDMRSVSGTIASINANTLTIQTSFSNPFDDLPKTRTVTIGDKTKIIVLKQKDSATYQKENNAFQDSLRRSVKPGTPFLTPPNPFETSTGTISDFKQGQFVNVSANENIRNKASFEAASVQISLMNSIPPMPPMKNK